MMLAPGPKADSFKNNALALQTQLIKARPHISKVLLLFLAFMTCLCNSRACFLKRIGLRVLCFGPKQVKSDSKGQDENLLGFQLNSFVNDSRQPNLNDPLKPSKQGREKRKSLN